VKAAAAATISQKKSISIGNLAICGANKNGRAFPAAKLP